MNTLHQLRHSLFLSRHPHPLSAVSTLSSEPSTPRAALFPVLLLLAVTGCQLTDPQFKTVSQFSTPAGSGLAGNQEKSHLLQPPSEPFTLGPGDKLELEILGDPTSRTTTLVGPDGKIYFNLLPGVNVWGLTLSQATTELQRQLGNYLREQPQVSMVLRGVESKRVWVLGRVQAPGVYALAAPITLLEAISMAGGTLSLSSYRDQEAAGLSEELADLDRSFVMREGKILPVNFRGLLQQGDLSQNIYLRADDFVYLPAGTAREVYVLGAVTQPRPVAFREGMTVARAIASAYGTLNGPTWNTWPSCAAL
jgi:polysaccharide biosynthesis/export protein